MSIIEKFNDISTFMGLLFEFAQTDELIKEDLEEHLKTLNVNNPSQNVMEGLLVKYIFERQIDGKSIITLYEEKNPNTQIDFVNAFKNNISGYFEIKKLHKNGFLLYNLLNEKEYDVISLVKMTNYRGIYAGLYVNARIFKLDETYYMLEISDVYEKSAKENILRYLVAKTIQEPESAYYDNPQKENDVKEHAKSTSCIFNKIFGKNEIITKNEYADDILNILNECYENNLGPETEISKYIQEPDEYKYFKVSEFQNDYNNFLENSLGGFSSHQNHYDVGIIANDNYGIYVMPFWGTINKIYSGEKTIEGALECIKYYLENDKIPLFIIEILKNRYTNFLEITNSYLNTQYSFEEIVNTYKKMYITNNIYSPTSVLYSSKIFTDTLNTINVKIENSQELTATNKYKDIGRNDLCPCGSGKKYKNCCYNK